MNAISKIAVGAGVGYVAGSGIKAIAGAPFAAIGGAVVLGFLIIVFSAIFDWTELDRMIHYAGAIIGFVSICAVIGLIWYGEVAPAVVIFVLFGLGWLIALPISHAIDERWDTPERRIGEYLSRGCNYLYGYSWVDGYCHFKHELYQNEWDRRYPEIRVPSDDFGLGEPLAGARENIARLKAAATPPQPTLTEQPAHRTFFGTVIYELTRPGLTHPGPWLAIIALGVYGYFNKARPTRPTPRVSTPQTDQHEWLAVGRKAAGLD